MHTLEELSSSTQDISGISCRFNCPEPILINDNNIATHLYKIAQEAVSNAVMHAKPTTIEVELQQRGSVIILTVKDDGVGFIQDPLNSAGIGLRIMKYRTHLIGASFVLEPNSPHGTVLRCTLEVPLATKVEKHEQPGEK